MHKIAVFDFNNCFHRAYHAPFSDLTTPKGIPIKGVYVYFTTLLATLRFIQPKWVVIALDDRRDNLLRRKMFKGYKSNRNDNPDEDITTQFQIAMRLTRLLGLNMIRADGHEADDVIASAVKQRPDNSHGVMITTDKDLFQLVKDGEASIYSMQVREYVHERDVLDKFGVPANRIKTYLSMLGDSIDCVPGVDGLGKKRAAAMVNAGKPYPLNESQLEQYTLSRRLITLVENIDLGDDWVKRSRYRGVDLAQAKPLLKELGFKRWI